MKRGPVHASTLFVDDGFDCQNGSLGRCDLNLLSGLCHCSILTFFYLLRFILEVLALRLFLKVFCKECEWVVVTSQFNFDIIRHRDN